MYNFLPPNVFNASFELVQLLARYCDTPLFLTTRCLVEVREIDENLYSRQFGGSLKIRGDCKNIQPLNYGVNPAETSREVSQRVRGHTFLLFSNWPCHFRLINISLPPANFSAPRAVGSLSMLFSQTSFLSLRLFSAMSLFHRHEFLTKLVSPRDEFVRRFQLLPSFSIVGESFNWPWTNFVPLQSFIEN